VYPGVSQIVLLEDLLWLRKITTDPHIIAHINIECVDVRHPTVEIYISELTVR